MTITAQPTGAAPAAPTHPTWCTYRDVPAPHMCVDGHLGETTTIPATAGDWASHDAHAVYPTLDVAAKTGPRGRRAVTVTANTPLAKEGQPDWLTVTVTPAQAHRLAEQLTAMRQGDVCRTPSDDQTVWASLDKGVTYLLLIRKAEVRQLHVELRDNERTQLAEALTAAADLHEAVAA